MQKKITIEERRLESLDEHNEASCEVCDSAFEGQSAFYNLKTVWAYQHEPFYMEEGFTICESCLPDVTFVPSHAILLKKRTEGSN